MAVVLAVCHWLLSGDVASVDGFDGYACRDSGCGRAVAALGCIGGEEICFFGSVVGDTFRGQWEGN
jgi:hypothetical protein